MNCPKCGKKYDGYFCPDCKSDSLTQAEFDKRQYKVDLKESGSGWKSAGIVLLIISLCFFVLLAFDIFALGGSYSEIIIIASISAASFNGSILCLLFWFLNEIRKYLKEIYKKQ